MKDFPIGSSPIKWNIDQKITAKGEKSYISIKKKGSKWEISTTPKKPQSAMKSLKLIEKILKENNKKLSKEDKKHLRSLSHQIVDKYNIKYVNQPSKKIGELVRGFFGRKTEMQQISLLERRVEARTASVEITDSAIPKPKRGHIIYLALSNIKKTWEKNELESIPKVFKDFEKVVFSKKSSFEDREYAKKELEEALKEYDELNRIELKKNPQYKKEQKDQLSKKGYTDKDLYHEKLAEFRLKLNEINAKEKTSRLTQSAKVSSEHVSEEEESPFDFVDGAEQKPVEMTGTFHQEELFDDLRDADFANPPPSAKKPKRPPEIL